MLEKPSAQELMQFVAVAGLAQNSCIAFSQPPEFRTDI
jgi:hypothetical protein